MTQRPTPRTAVILAGIAVLLALGLAFTLADPLWWVLVSGTVLILVSTVVRLRRLPDRETHTPPPG